MSKMTNWMIDMEDAVIDAIENGAKTEEAVLAGVKTAIPVVDENFVRETYREFSEPC